MAAIIPTPSAPLSTSERNKLARLEQSIEKRLGQFFRVGGALKVIRDKLLYREQFGTFEEYAERRWGIGRSYAYRLIEAANVIGDLSPMGNISPQSERQCRPLVPLNKDQRQEVWDQATNGGTKQPTTADLLEIIAQGADAYDALAARGESPGKSFSQATPEEQLDQINAAAEQARKEVEALEEQRELMSLEKAESLYGQLNALAERMLKLAKRARKKLVKYRRLSKRAKSLSGKLIEEIELVVN